MANVWLLASVSSKMICQCRALSKHFSTVHADKKLSASVRAQVRLKDSLLSKSSTAKLALKWFVTCMRPDIILECRKVSKYLAAEAANEPSFFHAG